MLQVFYHLNPLSGSSHFYPLDIASSLSHYCKFRIDHDGDRLWTICCTSRASSKWSQSSCSWLCNTLILIISLAFSFSFFHSLIHPLLHQQRTWTPLHEATYWKMNQWWDCVAELCLHLTVTQAFAADRVIGMHMHNFLSSCLITWFHLNYSCYFSRSNIVPSIILWSKTRSNLSRLLKVNLCHIRASMKGIKDAVHCH